jgi:uncharacterized protein (TIGR02186 family)
MRALLPFLCAAVLLALPARAAEEIVLGLSQAEVSITTNFDGSEILVYGAVKRTQEIPEGPPLEVVITVAGPSEPVIVRRKEKRFGIWINTDAVEVDRAPSYYAVVTSGPMASVLKRIEDLRYKVCRGADEHCRFRQFHPGSDPHPQGTGSIPIDRRRRESG